MDFGHPRYRRRMRYELHDVRFFTDELHVWRESMEQTRRAAMIAWRSLLPRLALLA